MTHILLPLTQVDASNIYGDNLTRQLQLRLHKDGKLKYQVEEKEALNPSLALSGN